MECEFTWGGEGGWSGGEKKELGVPVRSRQGQELRCPHPPCPVPFVRE